MVKLSRPSIAVRAATATAGARDTEVPRLQCTGATVRRLARRITTFYEHHLQPAGLTLSQYSLLAYLSEDPQSLRQLARRLETDRTTLTRSLRPLLTRRWVARVTGEDARRRLFVLTPGGRRARRNAREAWDKAQLALEKALGVDAVAALHGRLDDALAKLKAVLPEEN